jgi:hypothetical protein
MGPAAEFLGTRVQNGAENSRSRERQRRVSGATRGVRSTSRNASRSTA